MLLAGPPPGFRRQPSKSTGTGTASSAGGRSLRSWLFTILAMLPLSILGLKTDFIQDLMTELPAQTPVPGHALRVPCALSPAPTVVHLPSEPTTSTWQRLWPSSYSVVAWRRGRRGQGTGFAVQPACARLASRLGEVNAGFHELSEGADQLSKGLTEGAAKLRAAIWLEERTGLALTGTGTGKPAEAPKPKTDPAIIRAQSREALASSLKQARPSCNGPGVPAT